MRDFEGLSFAYRRSSDQDAATPSRHPVVVVGAGPVGLSLAIDLAQQGIYCVLLDDQLNLSNGSRAICFAKRTLEIFDRLGAGDAITGEGVQWHVGKVFFGDELLYQFDLHSAGDQHRPAFINLQQYVVEGLLVERAAELKFLDLRFGHRVAAIEQADGHVKIQVSTIEGEYQIEASYVVACDGARSTVRTALGLTADGQIFKDRFLIADVRMRAPFPAERWFWFDPPFHRNQSALLHRQPNDIWRIDFQLGWDADPELEKEPARVRERVAAMLGRDIEFDLVWLSVYTFSCQRIDKFVHDHVIFAGDSAHGVSPFGARGANGGIQDADNLAWKLAAVLRGEAHAALLQSYHEERSFATDENILHSTRSTDFITPKSPTSRMFRDAALSLAKDYPFARSLINSGRLSSPAHLPFSSLNSDDLRWKGGVAPGSACEDALILVKAKKGWLLEHVGNRFCLVLFCEADPALRANQCAQWLAWIDRLSPTVELIAILDQHAAPGELPLDPRLTIALDVDGMVQERYRGLPGAAFLIRPDQHVAARFIEPTLATVKRALDRALARSITEEACHPN